MKNLDEVKQQLSKYADLTLKTRELNELEINNYYIKKLCEEGVLIHSNRGEYKVNITKPKKKIFMSVSKKRYSYFERFRDAVLKNEYVSAYAEFKKMLEHQTNHNYDNHMRIYALLLKEILQDKNFDFSFIDDFYEFDEGRDNESYYDYFIKFRGSVMSKNFYEAENYLDKYREAEVNSKGYNLNSTLVFTHLIKRVNRLKRSKVISPEELHKRNNLCLAAHKSFLYYYRNKDYERALESLKQNIELNTYEPQKEKSMLIYETLKYYIELRKTKGYLKKNEFDYSNITDNYELIKTAISNLDFYTVTRNIGRITYQNETINIKILDEIVKMIAEESKKNTPVIKKTPKVVIKEEKSEVKKPEEIKELTDKDYYDMINDYKYDELRNYLLNKKKRDGDLNRLGNNLLKILRRLNEDDEYQSDFIYYKSPDDAFGYFFEAMRHGDFTRAYEVSDKCRELTARRNSDDYEFACYDLLLGDYINKKNEQTEVKNIVAKRSEVVNKILDIATLPMTIEKVSEIDNVLSENIGALPELQNIYSLVDMIKTVYNNPMIDASYFSDFTYESETPRDNLKSSISEGDYIKSLDIINKTDWNILKSYDLPISNLTIYKRLLFFLINTLNNRKLVVEKQEEVIIEDEPSDLITLARLIKKRDYKRAMDYYLEHDLNVDDTLNTDIASSLVYLLADQKNSVEEIFQSYVKSIKELDFREAKRYLDIYKESIAGLGIDRDITHHYRRVEAECANILTPEYEEKEKLYSKAHFCIKNEDYIEAIRSLKKYIELDHDITAKGYILLGRVYDRMHQRKDAIKAYKKAISIIPEPNAYHALGHDLYFAGLYQEALECFLNYEKARPLKRATNTHELANAYAMTGNKEMADYYNKITKRLKYLEEKKQG